MTLRHLQLQLKSDKGAGYVYPYGGVGNYKNEHGTAKYYCCHKPRDGSNVPFMHEARLSKGGAKYRFEMQIQVQLSEPPRGPLWLSAELRDGPMRLNLVTRSLCRVLLSAIKAQTAKRGIEFDYTFGNANIPPRITIPFLCADRVVFSNTPLPLPTDVDTDGEAGTWWVENGIVSNVERNSVKLQAGICATIIFSTSFLDFETWSITNIPGVGDLDLKTFWGDQPFHVYVHDGVPGTPDIRQFFELELASVDAENSVPVVEPTLLDDSGGEVKDTIVELADTTVEEVVVPVDGEHSDVSSVYTANDAGDAQDVSSDESDEEAHPSAKDAWDLVSNSSHKITQSVKAKLDNPREAGIVLDELAVAPIGNSSVSIPWYFCNSAGDVWWCIDSYGRSRWRHHNQLQDLGSALGVALPSVDASSCVQDLEFVRRTATALLVQAAKAPGLLEEFTLMDVRLSTLLSGEVQAKTHCMFVGLVETEGRIVERFVRQSRDRKTLWWICGRSKHRRRLRKICADLKHSSVENTFGIDDAVATRLSTPWKGFIFVSKDGDHSHVVARVLRGQHMDEDAISRHSRDSPSKESKSDSSASDMAKEDRHRGFIRVDLLRRVAEIGGCAGAPKTNNVHEGYNSDKMSKKNSTEVASELALSILHKAADVAADVAPSIPGFQAYVSNAPPQAPTASWRDVLNRWPVNRIVINDAEPYLDLAPVDAVGFSAELLHRAGAAQGQSESVVKELTLFSGGLKRISLDGLSPQDLWCFWVNVFHSLLLHAQLVAGRATGLQQIMGFYNNSSYLVSGHVLSLLEIEHVVLRRHMSQPHIRVLSAILKMWKRSDEDFENRPCLNAPFNSASYFACRPDWRLNLILNAGNYGSSEGIPVFERGNVAHFERAIQLAMQRTLSDCGRFHQDAVELPYVLCRYKNDAPQSTPDDTHERRWLRVVAPERADAHVKITYSQYGWRMRDKLQVYSTGDATIVLQAL